MSAPIPGNTLVLEASTYQGSVAVIRDGAVVSAHDAEMRGRDEERLMPAVEQCLGEAGGGVEALARIVCGAGPGSFTSLRIAASIAKGICHARDIPLFAVSSLALIVAAHRELRPAARFLATLDAMRGESYAAVFDVAADGTLRQVGNVEIVPAGDIGEAARVADAEIVEGVPHATGAARLIAAIVRQGAVDLATWEPDYGRVAEAQVKWEAKHGRPLGE